MTRKKGRRLPLSVVLISSVLIIATVVVAGPAVRDSALAGAPHQDDPGEVVVSSRSDPTWVEMTQPWTPSRMRNAAPYPAPVVRADRPQIKGADSSQPSGSPGRVPAGPPDVEYTPPTAVLSPGASGTIASSGYPYPPPYTRYEPFPGQIHKKFPYRTVGVLFLTQNGVDYRCSAASIGNYAVWTAGHCVSDGQGHWSTDFLFVPAYRDGNPIKPWAQWTGSRAWSTTEWHQNGNSARDMGGVVLNLANGRKVSVVGWLGFAWNQPRDQHYFQVGYPAGSPFDGNKMIICASSHSSDDNLLSPPPVGVGCDMTGGSSGGPWILDFSGGASGGNLLNGNVSFTFQGYPEEMYSPYFDDVAHELWNSLVTDEP